MGISKVVWCLNIRCILSYRKYLLCVGARFVKACTIYPKNQAEFFFQMCFTQLFPS